jgi:hypothetical protein
MALNAASIAANPYTLDALSVGAATSNALAYTGLGSIAHSGYRGYKEARADGQGYGLSTIHGVTGAMGGLFRIWGVKAGVGLLATEALSMGAGTGAAIGVGAGIAVNETFNALTKSREANMRLDRMRTVTKLPIIGPIRDTIRGKMKSLFSEETGEKLFPREHFGAGIVTPGGPIEEERTKEQYLNSIGVQRFLKAIQVTQSKEQEKNIPALNPDGTPKLDSGGHQIMEFPHQKLRDALSAYIPGYDQDDIHETEPEQIIENILRKAVNTEGGLLAGKSKKKVLEAIENFGNNVYIYDDVATLLSKDLFRGSDTSRGSAMKYKIFWGWRNRKLIHDVMCLDETPSKRIRGKMAEIILAREDDIDEISPKGSGGSFPDKKIIKKQLKNRPASFLQTIKPEKLQEEILDEFFLTEEGGSFARLLEQKLEKESYADLSSLPPTLGKYRTFNEKHDTALGGKKYGITGVIQSVRKAFSTKKRVQNANGEWEEEKVSLEDVLKNIAGLGSLLLAGKELTDMYKESKKK